jgi:hypothetical protein
MPHEPTRKLLIGTLILLMHLPMIAYVWWLYPQMLPGQSILDLPFLKLLLAVILAALPYAVLNRIAPAWNPERSRLGEYEP